MMWNERRIWIQWRGNVLDLELIWGTPINFAFLRWHQCSSRLVTVLLGRNWRIYPTFPPQLKKNHETSPSASNEARFPAMHAEQLRFPNQTYKEPWFAWVNSRISPTTLSQDEKNTDVTSGTQNWLVCPKSTQDEAHFPFIESIAVSHSTSYTTSVLTSFTTIQRFPETLFSSL